MRERRRSGPLQNFLSPVHAHVVVHPSGRDHLHLGGVPERVVGLGILKLRFGVENRPMVASMLAEGTMCPWLRTFKVVVVWIEMHEVHRKLAPGDDLVQECVFDALGRFGVLYRER